MSMTLVLSIVLVTVTVLPFCLSVFVVITATTLSYTCVRTGKTLDGPYNVVQVSPDVVFDAAAAAAWSMGLPKVPGSKASADRESVVSFMAAVRNDLGR